MKYEYIYMNYLNNVQILYYDLHSCPVSHTKRHWWDETTLSNLTKIFYNDGNASHLKVSNF